MHNLIVTEKPSVAQAIGKVLGATARRDGYLEGGGYLISWCVGHLVELAPPGAYDPRLERWDRAVPPKGSLTFCASSCIGLMWTASSAPPTPGGKAS